MTRPACIILTDLQAECRKAGRAGGDLRTEKGRQMQTEKGMRMY